MRRTILPQLLFALQLLASACDPRPGSEGGPGGSGSQDYACTMPAKATADFGTGKGLAYTIVAEGDELQLVFGSQAGMEARVVVEITGIPLEELVSAKVAVLVDGFPITELEVVASEFSCENRVLFIDAPMLVDVVPHPNVKSVLQLADRPALLTVEMQGTEGTLLHEERGIILLI